MSDTYRSYRLASRPSGAPTAENFEITTQEIPSPGVGQALLRTRYLSLDPYVRGRMDDMKSYAPPLKIGETIMGSTVAEVIESRSDLVKVGDTVLAFGGWSEYSVQDASTLRVLDPSQAPVTTALSVLGTPGFTAYAGLLRIGKPQPGETVAVAAATGPVGATVGQIAQIKGARTVGIAGGPQKVELMEGLGFDAALDHRSETLAADLEAVTPDGIDVYFENVAGKVLEAVLPRLNKYARIPLCGVISILDATNAPSPAGAQELLLRTLLTQSITVRGFIQSEFLESMHADFLRDMTEWVVSGRMKYIEDITVGFEHTVDAFRDMLVGRKVGKTIVEFTQ